jgi:EpsI family protein
MTRLHGHLVIVIALACAAALVVALPRGHATPEPRRVLDALPLRLGEWVSNSSSATVLPDDPRSVESLARQYSNGSRTVWLSVARYSGENGPDHRPALHMLVPERGLSSISRTTADIPLDVGAPPLRATHVALRFRDGDLNVWYWYALGDRLIGDEYSLRFWLALNTALRRDRELLLIRVASSDGGSPGEFVKDFMPALIRLRGHGERN